MRAAAPTLAFALTCACLAHAEVSVVNRQLEPGQTLGGALRAIKVDPSTVQRLTDALAQVVDPRTARAGHQLRLVREGGTVKSLDFRQGPLDEYQVQREGVHFVAAKRPVVFEKRVARFEFDVERSLYDAAMSSGTDPVVAMALTDAFGWDIDFVREAKLGDRARVLVETLVYRGRVVRYGDVLAASYDRIKGGSLEVFQYRLPDGDRAYFYEDGTSAQRTFLKSPVGWAPISSRFGWRMHPLFQEMRFHDGVDYGMPVGTPVRAVASGVVSFAGYTPGGGNMLCIAHDADYETCYLHLSKFAQGIQVDAAVFRKQLVAYSGNTGASTSAHLHYMVRYQQRPVDPLRQVFPRLDALPSELKKDFAVTVARYSAQLGEQPVPAPLR